MFRFNKINSVLVNTCRTVKLSRYTEYPVKISSVNYSVSKPLYLQDEPYRFRGSKAEKLSMDESFYNLDAMHPSRPIQKWVKIICAIAFCSWFGILREENHIDEQLMGKFDHSKTNPAFEFQLMMQYDHCKRNGIPYKHLEDQINEIRKAKGQFPI